ncbi:MAG: hypothetical protein ACXWQO_07200 [Bdellovibrionota bacterium]
MRILFSALLLAAISAPAFAAYDSSWYQDNFWSGEYPTGFSVVKKGTSVPARATMDLDAAKTISCALPYHAVFHPWNSARKATYRSASKIVVLTAKEDLKLGDVESGQAEVKKGETIEYLMNAAEGSFIVRFKGKKYTGDQDLFTHVEAIDDNQFIEHDWLGVKCENGKKAWIFMGDISTVNAQGDQVYLPGLDSWGLGFRQKYGEVRDIPGHN